MSPTLNPKNLFRFEVMWAEHDDYRNLLENIWSDPRKNFNEKLVSTTASSKIWSKEVFGDIKRKKRWIKGRIRGIQIAQAKKYHHDLFILELDLIRDYNCILRDEELMWMQRARRNW